MHNSAVSKVNEFHLTFIGHYQILQFQIAMGDSRLTVHAIYVLEYLGEDVAKRVFTELLAHSVRLDAQICEFTARNVLHDYVSNHFRCHSFAHPCSIALEVEHSRSSC